MSTTLTDRENTIPVGTWTVDPVHSSVEFQVRNMGLVTVKGFFTDFEGSLEIAEDGSATAHGSVQAASVQSRSEKRDAHLRAPDFFDVEQYPEITFQSTGIEPDGEGLRVRGELTIKDATHPIELHGELTGSGPDPWGGERVGLVVHGELDRRDYGLNWDVRTPGDVPLASNRVRLEIQLGAIKQD